MKRALMAAVAAAALLSAAAAVWAMKAADERALVPVAAVQRGPVTVTVRTLGDIRPSRAVQVFVPPVGGQLTIVHLASTGASVKAGDPVVEFDPADMTFALEQAQSELALAQQEIVKAEAQAAVQAAEDDVALLKARYAVRRAELDASGNELVGAIVAKQNLMLLDEAREALAQLERDVASRRQAARASARVVAERANKARVAVAVAERTIQSLVVRAPFDGYVTVRQNMMALGGIIFSGAVMPDFRVGDSASPGTPVVDLIDTSSVEVTAKLSERDRANVDRGQRAAMLVDGVPGAALDGQVRAVSSVASRRGFEGGGTRQFDIAFEIVKAPPRVWAGTSATVTINGTTFDDALSVPRSAIFDAAGTPTVYVRGASGFAPHPVKVRAWTETVAVVDGIAEGALVALVDPTKSGASRATPSAPSLPTAGSGR